ncbi:MAG: YaaC family protein [Hyphomicrobiaceae bacterium]
MGDVLNVCWYRYKWQRRVAMTKPWDVIANYESHELVRARYHGKHGREPNARHAREIASSFIQGRQYYAAASESDRAVKPLLLYYGVVSLSRGLVLFLKRSLREAALAQAHGLATRDWQSVLAEPNPDIGALRVEVTRAGSFPELLDATQNRNLIRGGSSAVNRKIELGVVPAGTAFSLDDLLARLPDVIDQYKLWKIPHCVRVGIQAIPGTKDAIITVHRAAGAYVTGELVVGIVGRDYCELVSQDAEKVQVRTTRAGDYAALVTDHVKDNFLGIGDIFLAEQLAPGLQLGKAGQLFAISYILGMLVRYNPVSWMDFIHQRVGDAGLPTVLRVIDRLEYLYPQIIVDFLDE